MALIECRFFSETLRLSCSMNVILPQRTQGQIGMTGAARDAAHPVLYLLHGLSDDHTIWLRRTSVERYVAPLGLAVVMPAVDRSFYCNMKYGNRYWDFISEEVPAVAREFFKLSDRREDTFVAGLSMGGFGAFKLALNQPERFAAAGSFSGALDMATRWENFKQDMPETVVPIFGEQGVGPENDLVALVKQQAAAGIELPRLYQSCGTEDFLIEHNRNFKSAADEAGVALTSDFRPGMHEWGFWDTDIQSFLAWLGFGK
jgi:putative tributyrin esterase